MNDHYEYMANQYNIAAKLWSSVAQNMHDIIETNLEILSQPDHAERWKLSFQCGPQLFNVFLFYPGTPPTEKDAYICYQEQVRDRSVPMKALLAGLSQTIEKTKTEISALETKWTEHNLETAIKFWPHIMNGETFFHEIGGKMMSLNLHYKAPAPNIFEIRLFHRSMR